MNLFKKIKETGLIVKNSKEQEITVSVPDIKEYLVKEYEKVNDLKLINEGLEQKLEQARELEMKYGATLVTLDEYSKRLDMAEREIEGKKSRINNLKEELRSAQNEIYTYKIKFTNAAITKEEIVNEIIEETKAAIISKINSCKGNLSKKIVCEIINSYEKGV